MPRTGIALQSIAAKYAQLMLKGRFRGIGRAGNETCGFVRSSEYTDAELGRTLQARSLLRESRRSSQLNDRTTRYNLCATIPLHL